LEKVLVEVELLAKLSHPNLVSYRHVWLEDVKLNRFGPTSVACAFILQQYCNGGDLLHYVIGEQPKETTKEELKAEMRRRSKGHADRPTAFFQRRLPFEEIYSLFKDITSGLAYLHATNYIHRDLKPSNCLLHREGNNLICLISDFGEVQQENVVRKSTGSTGTISYCAPEVLKKDASGRYGNFTTKSDIFSLGMILYFMCFGHLPYRSANSVQEELEDIDLLRAEITDWKGFQDERRERPDLPPKLYQLLKKLLALNPLERPSANEVLSAMKSESSLDGVTRGARSSSPTMGLSSRRIQNLDSPLPPSTPVPGSSFFPSSLGQWCEMQLTRISTDPAKQSKGLSGSDETVDEHPHRTNSQNSLQKHSNAGSGPRYRGAHAMTPSRSQDSYTRGASRSPEGNTRRSRHRYGSSHNLNIVPSRQGSPTITTPLLMPPPRTLLGEVHHRTVLAGHLVRRNWDKLGFVVRLAAFLGKMAGLARACWPYAAGWGVGAGLVAVAALDLALPSPAGQQEESRRRSDADIVGAREARGLTAGVDDGGVGAAGATRRGSSPGDPAGWEWEGDERRAWSWSRHWDWRASFALLVLHFVVLGLASHFGVLCASTHEAWADW
jgi:serine/threonine protein kinase